MIKTNQRKMFYFFVTLLLFIVIAYVITPSKKLFQLATSAEQALAGLSVKRLQISEGEISYLEGGKGETLLLLHGFGADKNNWNRLAKHLTSHYHVIAPDLPGFGDSFKNDKLSYDVLPQVNRLHELVKKLGLKKFHIAGNSMGGYIAGNYAAKYSEKISSLWLLNTLGVASVSKSEMFTQISQKKRPVVLAKNKKEYEELLQYVFHKRPFMPNFIVSELAKEAKRNFPIHAKIFDEIHNLKNFKVNFTSALDKVLKNFSKPVLITWGKKDRILHPDGAKALAFVIPKAQVRLMENVGHLPMIELPSATAKQFILFNKK
jgi:abhydrolase domain-containing protein 6